eukprot:scaffold1033_cov171-Amphora_coffeaeformis.AAC.9
MHKPTDMLQTPERVLLGGARLSKSGMYAGADAISSANTEEVEPSWLLLLLLSPLSSSVKLLRDGEDQTTANPMATASPSPHTTGNQRLETVFVFHACSSVPAGGTGTSCKGPGPAGNDGETVGSHAISVVVDVKRVVGANVGTGCPLAIDGISVAAVVVVLVGDTVGARVGASVSSVEVVEIMVGDSVGSG